MVVKTDKQTPLPVDDTHSHLGVNNIYSNEGEPAVLEAGLPAMAETSTSQTQSMHASTAGLYVSIVSALGIIAMIVLLAFHLSMIESPPKLMDASASSVQCSDQPCELAKTLLVMEENAQSHRASHVKSALSARLMTYVLAEIIALVMIVLGGMLIFNRIESGEEAVSLNQATTGTVPQRSFFLTTAFPGVLLCLFGSVTLVSAMFIPTTNGASISWEDAPVFHRDPNQQLVVSNAILESSPVDPKDIPDRYKNPNK